MHIGNQISNGKQVTIELPKIIENRMLIQANSGGGKSYTVRKFAEITYGSVQQIIIDVEGEFSSLREKFPDYLLIGKDGDIPVSLKSAELLAHRLLDLNMSAIIDLYELKHHERIRFVKLFFDAMINAPKELWHPCLVILDEAHIFAPEKGMGEAESLDGVKDMATRGRKRGFALVAATQRLSKLHKDVAAELNAKLIGRSSLDTDMKRASDELGFTTKEEKLSLRNLQKGEFYAFGPGISNEVIKIKVGKAITKHAESGQNIQRPTAPNDKIKQILYKLTDLPQEAEQELRTKEDFIRQIHQLKQEIGVLKRGQPKIDPEAIKKAEEIGYKRAQSVYIKKLETLKQLNFKNGTIITTVLRKTEEALHSIGLIQPLDFDSVEIPKFGVSIIQPIETVQYKVNKPIHVGQPLTKEDILSPLKPTELKVLEKILQRPDKRASRKYVALMAGYAVSGGGFANILGKLRTTGYIEYAGGDMLVATKLAEQIPYEPIPVTSEEMIKFWSDKLGSSNSKVFMAIVGRFPDSITRSEVAEACGYSESGGGFANILGKLRTLGLIDYLPDKQLKASEELFGVLA